MSCSPVIRTLACNNPISLGSATKMNDWIIAASVAVAVMPGSGANLLGGPCVGCRRIAIAVVNPGLTVSLISTDASGSIRVACDGLPIRYAMPIGSGVLTISIAVARVLD